MDNTFRIIGWNINKRSVKSVKAIHEVRPTKTLSGTHRKIGRVICELLGANSVNLVEIQDVEWRDQVWQSRVKS